MPKDPVILLSYVNTQLRDHYESPEELAAAVGGSVEEITEKLGSIGYVYDEKQNRYIAK